MSLHLRLGASLLPRHDRIWVRDLSEPSLRPFFDRTPFYQQNYHTEHLVYIASVIVSCKKPGVSKQWRDRDRKDGDKTPAHILLNLSRVISVPPTFSSLSSPPLITYQEGVEIFVREAWLGLKFLHDSWNFTKMRAWYQISWMCVKWNLRMTLVVSYVFLYNLRETLVHGWPKFSIGLSASELNWAATNKYPCENWSRTYWRSRRAKRENIWLEVMTYGPSARRSLHH